MNDSLDSRIDRFFFSPVDARWLAWLRIVIAVTYPYFFWSVGFKPVGYVPDVFDGLGAR